MGMWEGGPGAKTKSSPTRLLSLRGQGKHQISKHQVYNPHHHLAAADFRQLPNHK
jgi:hypothetical protein